MAEFESIEFEIKGSADKATRSLLNFSRVLSLVNKASEKSSGLQKLADGLSKIGNADGSGLTNLVSALDGIAQHEGELNNVVRYLANISRLDFSNLTQAASAIQQISNANVKQQSQQNQTQEAQPRGGLFSGFRQRLQDYIDGLNEASEASGRFMSLTQQLGAGMMTGIVQGADLAASAFTRLRNGASSAVSFIGGMANGFRRVGAAALRFAGNLAAIPFRKSAGQMKSFIGRLSGLSSSIKRVAFYRIIRSAIKRLEQSFDEGLKNAYAFSAGLSDALDGRIAVALDSLSGHAMTMKNQLGAAFGSLLAAIAPIINTIISLITALATAITQLFAAFTGGTFLKAKDVSSKFADDMQRGGGAAKEWKNQLMGFDEINRLEDQNGGGGGGGASALNPEDMFDVETVEGAFADFVNQLKKSIRSGDWQGVGKLLGDKINSIFPSSEKWKAWGTKVGNALKGIVNSAYYTLKATDFAMMGERIADFINSGLEKALSEDGGGSAAENFGRLLVRRIIAGLDFLIGGLGNLNWSLIGQTIGQLLTGSFDEITEWLKSYNWQKAAGELWKNLKGAIAAFDMESVAGSLSDAIQTALNSLVSFLSGLDFADVAYTLFDLLCDAISGADIVGIAASMASVISVAIFNIPSLIIGALASLAENIAEHFKEVGNDAAAGWWEGLSQKLRGAAAWLKTNFVDPIVNGIKDLLGIHSPSTVFAEIGDNTVAGFLKGFKDAMAGIKAWLSANFWQPIKTAIDSFFGADATASMMDGYGRNIITGLKNGIINGLSGLGDWIYSTIWGPIVSGLNSIMSEISNWWSSVTSFFSGAFSRIGGWMSGGRGGSNYSSVGKFASGGFPQEGQLFISREAGPELVGTMGGRTAVANNDQIVEGIKTGVMEAMSVVMSGNSNNNQPINIYMDGKLIARSTTRYQAQMARANG